MAKLIQQFPMTGDVMTAIGTISFVNGEAEVPDDVAEELRGISDIRIVIEEKKEEQQKEEPPIKAPIKAPTRPKAK